MRLIQYLCFFLLGSSCFSQEVKGENFAAAPIFPFVSQNIEKFNSVHRDPDGIPMLLYDNKYEYYPIQYTQVALYYYARVNFRLT